MVELFKNEFAKVTSKVYANVLDILTVKYFLKGIRYSLKGRG